MTPPPRMRVMHVMEAMVRGGAESLIIEHARCAGPGVEVLVCVLNRDGPALAAAEAAGARVERLPVAAVWKPLHPLARVFALAQRLRERGVDVVNGHNATGGLYAALAARIAGVPAVRTEHTLHYRGRHSVFYPILERLLTLMTQRVVCVCEAVLDSHVRRLPWAAGRFVTVANGISAAPHTRARHEVRTALGISPDDEVVLTVGSLTRQKAQDVLLEAFAAVRRTRPRARLLIVGDGPLRAALEAQAAAPGLGAAVVFAGAREDVADLMAACDLFVLSSVREGLPITLLEAMRAGRASVVSRIGGMPEAIEDGRSGRIVPARDPAALGAAIADLLGDAARRESMGEQARLRFEMRFTSARMVAETERVYRSVTARDRAAARDEARSPHASP